MGQQIYKNQGLQIEYDQDEPYIVMAFRSIPDNCRNYDANSEMGEVVLEAYTYNYAEMQELATQLRTHLNDSIIRHSGYRYDLERMSEDFDKVTTETDGLVVKEFTIIYHQNLDY